MQRRLSLLAIAAALTALTGCAQVQGVMTKIEEMAAQRHRETYETMSDSTLGRALYRPSQDFKKELMPEGLEDSGYAVQRVTRDSVHYKRRWITQEMNWGSAVQKMDNWDRSVLDDPIARKYIAVAQSRGSTVRLYKPAMGGKINGMFKQYHFLDHDKNTREWYAQDNMLIEYAADGRILSALTKSYQGIATLGVSIDEYVHVYFGPSVARHLENNLSNALFAEFFVRDLPLPRTPAPTVEEVAPRTPAAPTCQAPQRLARYASVQADGGRFRVDVVDVVSGRRESTVLSPDRVVGQRPIAGQFTCWTFKR